MALKPERGSGGTLADGLCMIDPVVLRGVINDLATIEAAITAETKGLKAEFDRIGVPATAVNDLTKVAAWLHGELPMLRRRHAAAVLLASQRMEPVPGTKMVSMQEDPALAAKQTGELTATRVLAGLDREPPNRDPAVAAAAAVRQITARKGRLSADDLAFLQAFYGGLGRAVYRVPGQFGDDPAAKSALVGGLLMLSNDKFGGGFDKLPPEIRQDLRDNAWNYWNLPGGKDRDTPPGTGFTELVTFLQNRDPKGTVPPGKQLALGLARSMADEFRIKEWLEDEYGGTRTGLPGQMDKNVYLTRSQAQDMLSLVSLNHNADAELMADRAFFRLVLSQDWDDDGKAVADLTNWAAKAAADPTSADYQLAKKATADLINIVTTNGSDEDGPHPQVFQTAANGAKVNPEIARAFSRLVAANISDFGEDDPGSTIASSTKGDLEIPTDKRHRFAMLAAMDPQGRAIMRIASQTYKMAALADRSSEHESALRASAIDGIIIAASHNALYYDNIADSDDKNKARTAQIADEQAVTSILRQFYDTSAGTVSGGTPIGLAKMMLTKLLDEGMKLPEPAPVLPGKVSTDADATGALVPQARAAHDLAEARLRNDGTPDKTGLQTELLEPGPNGHPKLKDFADMNGSQRAILRRWAEQNGGADYVKTYTDNFGLLYTDGELVNKGAAALKDYLDSPTPR
jgi:hypothetical protein